MFGST